tara:strand:- start:273 stop:524 length:252 start_codon:yes stop_codon:yes gene_type:complete
MSMNSLNNIAERNQRVEAVKSMVGNVLDFVAADDWDIRRVKETLEENKAEIEGLKGKLEAAERVLSRNDLEGAYDAEKVLDEA